MVCEFGLDNVCVNCIILGLIQIDIIVGKLIDDMMVNIFVGILMNCFGDVIDIVCVVLFFGSDFFFYFIGIILDVNGGMLIY